jgi:hypothetical protein
MYRIVVVTLQNIYSNFLGKFERKEDSNQDSKINYANQVGLMGVALD